MGLLGAFSTSYSVFLHKSKMKNERRVVKTCKAGYHGLLQMMPTTSLSFITPKISGETKSFPLNEIKVKFSPVRLNTPNSTDVGSSPKHCADSARGSSHFSLCLLWPFNSFTK